MDVLPISVFIIAQDEEDRIAYTINSVKGWVREIIVIDSGSKDNTVKLCEDLGAKTFFNEWEGYGKQKIFGEQQCQEDWILNLDADEAISDNLKSEIMTVFCS